MRTLSLLLALVTGFSLFANEKSYTSKVHEVTLFLKGAQLERKVTVNLEKGRNTVILSGLEADLNINSLMVKGAGSFIIMDYRFEMKYIENKPTEEDKFVVDMRKKIALLTDSMVLHGDVIEDLENKQMVINAEKTLLLNNPLMKGSSIGDSLNLLAEAVEFLRERYNEVNEILQELKVKLRAEYKIRDAQNQRLADMHKLLNQRIQETQTVQSDYRLVVTIDAENAIQGTLSLSYLINNAGWQPKYEVHVKGKNEPVQVITKASVYQYSGQKWENVKLNISTNNPYESKTKPVLYPWWISPYNPAQYGAYQEADKAVQYEDISVQEVRSNGAPAQTAADYTLMNTQMMNRVYEISLPYDIPAEGTRVDIQIQKDEMVAEFRHYLVPSQNRNSFVVARIGDWGKLNLMTNMATVYYDNTLIGNVNLDTRQLSDTLEISLGQDKDVYADRVLMADNSKKTITGSKKVMTQEYEYTIMNRKNEAITVYVEDQIPMSNNSEIEVSIDQKASTLDYTLDASTGIWTAQVALAAKGKSTGRLAFQIKYPKEMTVQGF
jgi:uncharacterized protein (TIGR02231 family)